MKRKIKTIIRSVACVLMFSVLLSLLTGLVMPKYSETLVEGGMIPSYYEAVKDNEVIFIGDCEVYANFDPVVIFETTGITSFLRASSQQLMWQSYGILKETFACETPKAVVLSVNAMKFDSPVKEEYNRLTLDYMKWSSAKIETVRASMTEEETFLSYVFPILRYHSRIFELTDEDFKYLFARKTNTFNGHLVNTDTVPVGTLPAKRVLPDYAFSEVTMDYLDRIRMLCGENGSELILIKAPSLYPYWYDEYDEQIREYASAYGIRYYNLYDVRDEIGLDYSTDTYDAGMHLNQNGAVKLSEYFALILQNDVGGFTDLRYNEEVSSRYERMRQDIDSLTAGN